jgi:transcriptional regulator with XRE-family HTH domain
VRPARIVGSGGADNDMGRPLAPLPSFGDLVRHYRRELGLTQEALAERAGLSQHGIQKLERGVTQPYRDTARRLEAALQLAPDDRARLRAAVRPVRRHQPARARRLAASARSGLPGSRTSFSGGRRSGPS